MQRRWLSAGLSAGGLIGLLGWLWHALMWLLDTIGRAQTAKAIYENGPINVQGVTLSWGTIYWWLFVACMVFLIAANWEPIIRWHKKRLAKNKREWTITLPNAANWLLNRTYFGETLGQEPHAGLMLAAKAIETEATAGRLHSAARRNNGSNLEPLAATAWANNALHFKIGGDRYRPILYNDFLHADGAAVGYVGLMFDEREMAKIWPPKPIRA